MQAHYFLLILKEDVSSYSRWQLDYASEERDEHKLDEEKAALEWDRLKDVHWKQSGTYRKQENNDRTKAANAKKRKTTTKKAVDKKPTPLDDRKPKAAPKNIFEFSDDDETQAANNRRSSRSNKGQIQRYK